MEFYLDEDVKKVRQLLVSEVLENAQLALELLKGNTDLKNRVQASFQSILDASNKKSLKAIPTIVKQLRLGKGTIKARLQIASVPEIYSSIEFLSLNEERIELVPNWVRHLSNLKGLALSGCHLKELPEWIGELKLLSSLTIADNNIKELPSSFGMLENLEYCYIIHNKLTNLPSSIEGLIHLKQFFVTKGNAISKTEVEEIKKMLPRAKVV
jgi:Leucine-rich repeat (LRR) protein